MTSAVKQPTPYRELIPEGWIHLGKVSTILAPGRVIDLTSLWRRAGILNWPRRRIGSGRYMRIIDVRKYVEMVGVQ